MEKWITVAEAAKLMGIDTSLVRRYARDGVIGAQKFGNAWQISATAAKSFKRQKPPKE